MKVSKYDSWLSIGITTGNFGWRRLSSTGLNFDSWSETTVLSSSANAAAVFFTVPDDATPCDDAPPKEIIWPTVPCLTGPRKTGQPKAGKRQAVIAQLTMSSLLSSRQVTFDAQVSTMLLSIWMLALQSQQHRYTNSVRVQR
jgi:hypothetical protein